MTDLKIELNYQPIGVEDVNIPDSEGMDVESIPATNTPAVPSSQLNIVDSGDGSVVNLGALKSSNFSTGVAGWRLDSNGNLEANDGNFRGDITGASGTFSGTITAIAGAIGGWSIDATSIYTGTEDHSGYTANAGDLTIYSDGTDASIHAKNFYIDTSGNLVCQAGTIGSLTISSIALYFDGATDALSAGIAPADYPFYAGKKYADRATAPFRVTPAGKLTVTDIVATGTINAQAGYLSAGVYIDAADGIVCESGGLNVGVSGHIRGGQTDYNTGTGFFLGYSGGAYKQSIGTATNYMNFDGTNLILKAILKLLGTLELKSYTVATLPTISGDAKSPGTMAEVVRSDTTYFTEWFNVNNAKLSDDTYCENGDVNANQWDFQVKLVKGGTITGDNKATITTIPAVEAYLSYGASDNLWGTTLTPADVNASTFGFVFTVFYLNDETTVATTANSGDTSLILTDSTGYDSGGGWVKVTDDGANDMLVLYTGITSNTLTGIPASGEGSITATATNGNSVFEIKTSNFLKATNFNFAVPTNSTINGVVCEVETKLIGSHTNVDHMRVTVYYSDNINPVLAGSTAYASDGRKAGEGVGSGTGVLVFSDGNKWIACDTGAEVSA